MQSELPGWCVVSGRGIEPPLHSSNIPEWTAFVKRFRTLLTLSSGSTPFAGSTNEGSGGGLSGGVPESCPLLL